MAVGDDPQAMFRAADAVLDFTLPGAPPPAHGRARGCPMACILVVGTTGIGEAEQAALDAAGRRRLRWCRRPI